MAKEDGEDEQNVAHAAEDDDRQHSMLLLVGSLQKLARCRHHCTPILNGDNDDVHHFPSRMGPHDLS